MLLKGVHCVAKFVSVIREMGNNGKETILGLNSDEVPMH